MRRLLPALLIAAAALAAGCGGSDDLSADEAADEFANGVADVTGGEPPDVQCKDASEENYWDCSGKIAGFPTTFQLHLEGDTIDIVKPADRVEPAS